MADDWLSKLQVGDVVIVQDGLREFRSRVSRVTKTLIMVRGVKFRRRSGMASGTFVTTALCPVTPEALKRIEKANFVARLRDFDWTALPLESLAAVYRLLPKGTD